MSHVSDAQIQAVLKDKFGYESLRGIQGRAVRHLVSGEDVLITAPTGFGKSMCFQLPALVIHEAEKSRGSVGIIVCPLISLLHNQVAGLKTKHGIACELISSSESQSSNNKVINALLGKAPPPFALVYVTAERLVSDSFLQVLSSLYSRQRLSLVAIDEAHCISQWGHDFRPAYSKLGVIKERFPAVPIAALTATATTKVQRDILKSLNIVNAKKVHKSFLRTNIRYECRYPEHLDWSVEEDILEYVQAQYCFEKETYKCGIIYAFKTGTVDELAALLIRSGIPAVAYHGKKSAKERKEAQLAFESGKCPIAVASVAFGMGIDVTNIRYVIHHSMPKSVEAFYQESGRAGRDGFRSDSILYYSAEDVALLRFLATRRGPDDADRQKGALHAAERMEVYCTSLKCRRVSVLAHFDEKATADEVCNATWGKGCDVCHDRNDVKKRMRGAKNGGRVNVTKPRRSFSRTTKSPAAEFHSARTLLQRSAPQNRDEVEEISDDEADRKVLYDFQRTEGIIRPEQMQTLLPSGFASARSLLQQQRQQGFRPASDLPSMSEAPNSRREEKSPGAGDGSVSLAALMAAEERDSASQASRLRRPRQKINEFLQQGSKRRSADGATGGSQKRLRQTLFGAGRDFSKR